MGPTLREAICDVTQNEEETAQLLARIDGLGRRFLVNSGDFKRSERLGAGVGGPIWP